jgi:hypothetical protein
MRLIFLESNEPVGREEGDTGANGVDWRSLCENRCLEMKGFCVPGQSTLKNDDRHLGKLT